MYIVSKVRYFTSDSYEKSKCNYMSGLHYINRVLWFLNSMSNIDTIWWQKKNPNSFLSSYNLKIFCSHAITDAIFFILCWFKLTETICNCLGPRWMDVVNAVNTILRRRYLKLCSKQTSLYFTISEQEKSFLSDCLKFIKIA